MEKNNVPILAVVFDRKHREKAGRPRAEPRTNKYHLGNNCVSVNKGKGGK